MKLVWTRRIWLVLAAVLILSALGQSLGRPESALSADEIIQKAVNHAQSADAQPRQGGYTYTKVTLTEELDSTGKVKEQKEKVYQVSFQDGSTQVKLVEVNGRAPKTAD